LWLCATLPEPNLIQAAHVGIDDVNIRRASPADLDAAYALMESLGYARLDRGRFGQTFAAVLNHPETVVLLAEAGGSAIGLMSLSYGPQLRLAGIAVSIDELVVAETARGQGIGRRLLEEARAFAQEVGARRLELQTRRARESYQRGFYIKNGFSEAPSAIMRLEL
jgi:ribosomal protein S18 acetylase RimI-like enzyme